MMTATVPVTPKEGVPENEGCPRRHHLFADIDFVETYDSSIVTMYDSFSKGIRMGGNEAGFGKRVRVDGKLGPYVWTSYTEAGEKRDRIASALIHKGFSEQEMVGIFSVNRFEWIVAEQASYGANLCTVPLYDTLGDDAIAHIINETEMKIIFLSKDKIENLIKLREKIPTLTELVCMEDTEIDDIKQKVESANLKFFTMSELETLGRTHPKEPRLPKKEDLCTICYTSGTTGLPKGVMLTHANVLADLTGVTLMGEKGLIPIFTRHDVYISYLPLAHVLERVVLSLFISLGSQIGFYSGNVQDLMDDVKELKPTFFPSVPRLFNKIYSKVLGGVNQKGGLTKFLFDTAYQQKINRSAKGLLGHWLWDPLVFKKVQAALGGKVHSMLSGSAPLSADVMKFLRVGFAVPVYEGYGQTETSAGACLTINGDYTTGHVGVPLPCCEVKLVDVPEMGYSSKDSPNPRGEICFRGTNCFKGYYKSPEKTAETIINGWVHTGDIGMWNKNGFLVIIDRKKNIFKLSQGEYIAPEKIESVFAKHEFIAQCFIYGHSLKSELVMIVVLDPEAICSWATKNSIQGSYEDLTKSKPVHDMVLKSLGTFGKSYGLKGFEIPKEIYLESEAFTVENDAMTPTFKIKRHVLSKKYADIINDMYIHLNE